MRECLLKNLLEGDYVIKCENFYKKRALRAVDVAKNLLKEDYGIEYQNFPKEGSKSRRCS